MNKISKSILSLVGHPCRKEKNIMNKIHMSILSLIALISFSSPVQAAITIPDIASTDFDLAATGVFAFVAVVVAAGVALRFFKKA